MKKRWWKRFNQGVFWKPALEIGFYGMIIEIPLFLILVFFFGENPPYDYVLTWSYYLLILVSVISLLVSIKEMKKKYKKLAKRVFVVSLIALLVLIVGVVIV